MDYYIPDSVYRLARNRLSEMQDVKQRINQVNLLCEKKSPISLIELSKIEKEIHEIDIFLKLYENQLT